MMIDGKEGHRNATSQDDDANSFDALGLAALRVVERMRLTKQWRALKNAREEKARGVGQIDNAAAVMQPSQIRQNGIVLLHGRPRAPHRERCTSLDKGHAHEPLSAQSMDAASGGRRKPP